MVNVLQGMQYVQQQGEHGREQGRNRRLQGLAPAVISGDPAAYEQAAAIDPQAAQQYQGAGDAQMRRLKGAMDFIDSAKKAGNPQAVEAAYQQVRPYLARFGQEPPATFAEAEPRMEAARARIAMAMQGGGGAIGVQSTYVDEAGNRVAIMRDGSTQVLGRNDPGMQAQTITVTGADGRPRQMTFNKRTGSYEEAQFGGAQAQPAPQQQGWQQTGPTMFTAADGQPIPPEDQQALLAAVQQAERTGGAVNVPASQPAQMQGGPLPPRLDYQNGGNVNPFVGQSPAEKAASEAAARRQVELSTLPAELQMRTDAAVQQAGAIAGNNAQVQRDSEAAKIAAQRSTTLQMYETAMRGLREGLAGTETGPVVGRIPAFTSGQQIAEGAVAAMAPILKQLFRAAGEGTFTDRDQALLLEMVPKRTDTEEARSAKMANIDAIVRAKLGQGGAAGRPAAAASGPQPGAPARATNPQTGQVIELRNGAWVPVQ